VALRGRGRSEELSEDESRAEVREREVRRVMAALSSAEDRRERRSSATVGRTARTRRAGGGRVEEGEVWGSIAKP
jgi:hypothetical protein